MALVAAAIVENTVDGKIGHGFLVEGDLLVTCAHVVGDVESEVRPLVPMVKVTFANGESARGTLHALGWFPLQSTGAGFQADIAVLRLTWDDRRERLAGLHPVTLGDADRSGCDWHLRVTMEQGRSWSFTGLQRAWTSPKLILKSSPAPGDEIIEFTPDDSWDPQTEQGWSGAPVVARMSDGNRVVAMWNGAPKAKLHRGQAISARVLRRAVDHCLQDIPSWGKKRWSPYPFTEDARLRDPLRIEDRHPISGQVGIRRRDEEQSQSSSEVIIATGIAGVCSLDVPDAGTVVFGVTSARLLIDVEHMTVQPYNRVSIEGARATAELEGIPSSKGPQQLAYYIRPNQRGDVLIGNVLAGESEFFVTMAFVKAREELALPPSISGSMRPEFRVMELPVIEGTILEEHVLEFKKLLIEKLLDRHGVGGQEVYLGEVI